MNPDAQESGGFPIKETAGQASRFFAVGLVATGVHMAVALGIVHFFHSSILVANIAGYCLAFLFSYFGHTSFSFRTDFSRIAFLRFLVTNSILFLVSLVVSFTLDRVEVNAYLGVFITVFILPPLSFLIHKFVTFRL